MSLIVLVKLLRGRLADPVNFDNEVEAGYSTDSSITSLPHYVYWLTGLVLGCYLFGYLIAIGLFFVVFLLLKARTSMIKTLSLTGAALAFLVVLSHLMVLDMPRGLLQEMVQLPWPLS
jgi:hypothetical protein